jgi:hypothetical protein
VVVYKVDRLTRSLADFAKIVDAFDAKGVAFVSATQHFNTTTSMGRLTLNMLLSFAQFEREVTGERIPDKIAASKAKRMWMGGYPPLGYDLAAGKLVDRFPIAWADQRGHFGFGGPLFGTRRGPPDRAALPFVSGRPQHLDALMSTT